MYTNGRSGSAAVEALWRGPCLAAQALRLHRVIVRSYDDALRPHGLTAAQLAILMTLLTAGQDLRSVDLARRLRMGRSTVSRNLGRLDARGLATTTPGPTAREAYVAVTPAGRQAVEAAAPAWLAAQQAMRDRLGDDGIAALNTLAGLFAEEDDEE